MQNTVDYGRKWHVLTAAGMGVLLATIDGSIVNIALPTLTREFSAAFSVVQWVVLAYLLTVSTLLLTVGRLADMVGKKSLYLSGFLVFTVGSALCGIEHTVYWLIACRVVQAVGASLMLALGAAILTEAFPREERGRALGFSGSIVSIGIIVGPTLGGLIIDALSWHWIFFVNIPVGITGTIMVLKFVPTTARRRGQRFDYAGALTLFVSLLSFLLGLTLAQNAGLGNPGVLMLLGVFVIFLAVFHYLQVRVSQPMIDLALLKNSEIATGLILGFTTFVAMAGTVLLMPFYLENVLGYSPRHVGLLLAVVPAAVGVVSPVSGALSDRFGTRPMIVAGLLCLLVGLYAVSTLGESTTSLGYIIRFLPIGLGMGLFQSPNNSAIMGSAPQERLGIVSGLLALTRTVGQTSGIAILGAIWASRVSVHSSTTVSGGTTTASTAAQVTALHDTFKIVAVLAALVIVITTVTGYLRRRTGLA